MDSKYIRLVIATHPGFWKKYLFCAPAWKPELKPGDRIICDTSHGKQEAIVVDTLLTSPEERNFMFAVNGLGATLPLRRVLNKVTLTELNYDGYDEYSDYVNIGKEE